MDNEAVVDEKKCILIVDDEPVVRETLSRMVTALGHEVYVAANAPEAVDLCKQHHLDLMLLDMMMPDNTGAQLARMIFTEMGKPIPFYICSGYSDEPNIRKAMDAGALGFISKPVLLGELKKYLSKTSALPSQ